MKRDIVGRLRSSVFFDALNGSNQERLMLEAASLIEEMQTEIARLRACRDELRRVTEAMDDPRINNTITLVEAVRELVSKRDAIRYDPDRR